MIIDEVRQQERGLPNAELSAASHAFLIASLVAAIDPSQESEVVNLASRDLNPHVLLRLARNHRVLPMVQRAITIGGITLPKDVSDTLSLETRKARLATFANTGEEVRLASAVEAAGLDAIFIKGATLSHLVYADPSLKSSWDIDMLVDRTDLRRACALLREQGFVIDDPHGLAAGPKLDSWIQTVRETAWHHPQRGTTVELHIGLSDTTALLDGVGTASPRQGVLIGGIAIPTLADEQLFTYLCVHGTCHGWARLKWLVDVTAMVSNGSHSPAEWRRIAAENGAGRCGDVMLVLSHQILGTELPSALVADLKRDAATGRIVDYCLAQIDRIGMKGGAAGPHTISEVVAYMRNLLRCGIGLGGFMRTAWALWNRPYGGGLPGLPSAVRPLATLIWLPWRITRRVFLELRKL